MIRRINHLEAKALAHFIHAVRDDWGEEGTLAALGQARDHGSLEEITRWAIAAALNPSNRGPAIIALPGPHRAAATSSAPTQQKFDRHTTCGTCGKNEPDCRRLWAEDHAFESVAHTAHRRSERGEDYDQAQGDALSYAREAVAEAKAIGPEPPPERERKHSPHVDELRAAVAGEVAE